MDDDPGDGHGSLTLEQDGEVSWIRVDGFAQSAVDLYLDLVGIG